MRFRVPTISLSAESGCVGVCTVSADDRAHPNKLPFSGTLLILDKKSDEPPNGAEGHLIYVSKKVAKRCMASLIGTGLNYKTDLDGHAPRRKVGVITGARIKGDRLQINGFIWKKDFPEAVKDLRGGRLGMSMELADVYVRDKDESVWHLEDFHFSGATALYKKAAAYFQTALAAAAAAYGLSTGEEPMAKTAKKKEKEKVKDVSGASQAALLTKAIAAGVGPAVHAAVSSAFEPLVRVLKKQNMRLAAVGASIDDVRARQIAAAEEEEDEEKKKPAFLEGQEETDVLEDEAKKDKEMGAEGNEEEEDEDMKAAEGDEEEEDEDMKAAEGGEEEEEDEVKAALEDLEEQAAEEEPGELEKDAENKGKKTTVTAERVPQMAAAASKLIRSLKAEGRRLRLELRIAGTKGKKTTRKLLNRINALEAQAERYAEHIDRRTVSPEVLNLLAKQGVDIRELQAESRKLSVGEVDNMLDSSGVPLDAVTRMTIKNQLLAASLSSDQNVLQ